MNSDNFDRIVLELVYGELDELTALSAQRHMHESSRAQDIYAHFRATRAMTTLRALSPPIDFTEEVLRREEESRQRLPLPQQTERLISVLASYAMRPQLVMGVLLMLMIGSSLVLLRTKPGQHGPMHVTERGAPEVDEPRIVAVASAALNGSSPSHGLLAQSDSNHRNGRNYRISPNSSSTKNAKSFSPRKRTSSLGLRQRNAGHQGQSATRQSRLNQRKKGKPEQPSASSLAPTLRQLPARGLSPFEQAVEVYRAGRYVEAQRRFNRLAEQSSSLSAPAALYAARSLRMASGCVPAIERLEQVRLAFPGTPSAYEAAWRSANCSVQAGDSKSARSTYKSLLKVPAYSKRALLALKRLKRAATRQPFGSDP